MQSRSMWRAHGIRLPRFRTLMSRIEQRPRMMCVRCAPDRCERSVIDPRARPGWARPIAEMRARRDRPGRLFLDKRNLRKIKISRDSR
jgi:hypothetical protein